MTDEPIVRLQTPPGRGGIAVISLTGCGGAEIVSKIFQPWSATTASPRGALQLGHIIDDGRIIDEAIVHHAPAAIEINIHGGPAVGRAVVQLLARCGAKPLPAEPSAPESFAAAHPDWNNPAIGREMLAALPSARSGLVAGALTQQWRAGISRLAGETIGAPAKTPSRRIDTGGKLRAAAAALDAFARLLDPPEVVLAGPPNAGKSSLCNTLVGRAVSIVHQTAGTTRDWVRELALLDGVPIWLTDTAGIWRTEQPAPGHSDPDAQAVARARQRLARADLVVLLSCQPGWAEPEWLGTAAPLRVATKADVRGADGEADVVVSAHTGDGLAKLRQAIREALGLGNFDPAAAMAFTRRQADCLARAAEGVERGDHPAAVEALEQLLGG